MQIMAANSGKAALGRSSVIMFIRPELPHKIRIWIMLAFDVGQLAKFNVAFVDCDAFAPDKTTFPLNNGNKKKTSEFFESSTEHCKICRPRRRRHVVSSRQNHYI